MKKLLKISLAALALSVTGLASAMPIQGQISLTGNVTFDQPIPNATVATITSVAVGDPTSQTGTYAGLNSTNSSATMVSPLAIDPATFIGPQSIPGLWVVTSGSNTYSFDLTKVLSNTQSPGFLNIYGVGTLHATGYDDTSGEWWFTAQGNVASVTFSSTNVPEPSVLALIGIGILALGLVGFGRRGRSMQAMAA